MYQSVQVHIFIEAVFLVLEQKNETGLHRTLAKEIFPGL